MDERRARTHEDLRGLVSGDLLFDSIGRAPYAHDASIYEIDPLGVIVPRSVDDVVATVKYAAERSFSVHPRGAGTGLAGGCLGPGLVVDFSRYCRRIIAIRAEDVVVQPGVIVSELEAQLASRGRRLGHRLSRAGQRTVGGMIALGEVNSSTLPDGSPACAIESLEIVFANGERATVGVDPWPSAKPVGGEEDFKTSVLRRIELHLEWHGELIERGERNGTYPRAGYALAAIARPEGIDLARLIAGSEGTLGLITQATLATEPLPEARTVLVVPFARLSDATEATGFCLDAGAVVCDLFDWRHLNLARDAHPLLRERLPEVAEAALVLAFEGAAGAVDRQVCELQGTFVRRPFGVGFLIETTQSHECNQLLDLHGLIQPSLMRARGPVRPVPFLEDVAVPCERLPEFLPKAQSILKSHGVNWMLHADAARGIVRIWPFLDLANPDHVALLEPLARGIGDAAMELDGSITANHGWGLVRSPLLRRQVGELSRVFDEIKNAFDPQNLLNPGKIVGVEPDQMTRNLKQRPPRDEAGELTQGELPVLNAPLLWPTRSRSEHIEACTGCGDCRTILPDSRICPTFRSSRAEAASPRTKAQLLRQIAVGAIDPRLWGAEELRANADLCVHCGLCRIECPAGIDISNLMIEAKAAYVENHGLTPTDWTFSHIEVWGWVASLLPILCNGLLASQSARWFLERFFGLSRHRVLPRAHRWPFLGRAERRGLARPRPQRPGPRVAYFVDLFANYFDQELAESVVAVLEHAGVNVYVPRGQRGSGMAALVAGDLDRARSLVSTNLRVLGDAVRDGYTIVCSEPSAALMFQVQVPTLTDDLDAELVAKNTMDVGQYLLGLAERGQLPEPTEPITARVGYHQPCHLRAVGAGTPGLDLIRKIPGLEAEFIDRGCSGGSGMFGLTKRNFRTSLRTGRDLRKRLKDPVLQIGSTECTTCRMQMEQSVTKRTVHPMKLLALSYGLNPALRRHVTEPKPRHAISD